MVREYYNESNESNSMVAMMMTDCYNIEPFTRVFCIRLCTYQQQTNFIRTAQLAKRAYDQKKNCSKIFILFAALIKLTQLILSIFGKPHCHDNLKIYYYCH